MRRVVGHWLAVAWIGFAVLPRNAIGGSGFLGGNRDWATGCCWSPPRRSFCCATVLRYAALLWATPLSLRRSAALLRWSDCSPFTRLQNYSNTHFSTARAIGRSPR